MSDAVNLSIRLVFISAAWFGKKAAFLGGGVFSSSPALAQGAGNCLDGANKIENPGDTETLTAPAGQVITTVAIKAGTPCITFTSDGTIGCYTVSGIGTNSVTVTRSGSGPGCKEISHIEFITSSVPPPTTTETIPTTTTG
jgi:hypothetical protein